MLSEHLLTEITAMPHNLVSMKLSVQTTMKFSVCQLDPSTCHGNLDRSLRSLCVCYWFKENFLALDIPKTKELEFDSKKERTIHSSTN